MMSKLSINGSVARRRNKDKLEGTFAQERKTKSDWATGKEEEAAGRKLALVAQEIKAEQEPHYHDNEKQRKSDNVTDIHDW